MAKPNPADVRTPIARRREYLIREIQEFIQRTGGENRTPPVSVEAVPEIYGPGGYRARYRLRVQGDLIDEDWFEELRDIINRARSLLDNAMWAAAKGGEAGKYTSKEKNAIKFPIAHQQSDWDEFCTKEHAKELSQSTIDALRALQPFATGDPSVSMFNKANNVDKHRDPLELAVMPDSLFAMVLTGGVAGVPGENGKGFAWEPRTQVKKGQRLLEYVSHRPLGALEAVKVPVALCVHVEGDWLDVQEFLKDIIVFTAKASFILDGEDTVWADMHEKKFAAERARLVNFRSMLRDADPIAEALWLTGH